MQCRHAVGEGRWNHYNFNYDFETGSGRWTVWVSNVRSSDHDPDCARSHFHVTFMATHGKVYTIFP